MCEPFRCTNCSQKIIYGAAGRVQIRVTTWRCSPLSMVHNLRRTEYPTPKWLVACSFKDFKVSTMKTNWNYYVSSKIYECNADYRSVLDYEFPLNGSHIGQNLKKAKRSPKRFYKCVPKRFYKDALPFTLQKTGNLSFQKSTVRQNYEYKLLCKITNEMYSRKESCANFVLRRKVCSIEWQNGIVFFFSLKNVKSRKPPNDGLDIV